MKHNVQPIPEGFHTVNPHFLLADVEKEIAFLKAAFDAQPVHISRMPDGVIMHAIVKVGNSMVMMGQARGEWKPVPAMVYMYVEDMDAVYRRALAAGATSIREPANQFYGDRCGGVTSVNGIQWWIATHIEDVSEEELERRCAAGAGAGA